MANRAVRVGSIVLGEGMPKICVPVMGTTPEELRAAARRARLAGADLIELRIDSLSPMPEAEEAAAACRAVREASGLPLIFTLRTARDGGAGDADAAAYEALLAETARGGACDAVDVELSAGEAAFARIARAAHEAGVIVVGSSHAFGRIADARLAGNWLSRQARLGADVLKAAVMAHSRTEALALCLHMARAGEAEGRPYIAIAMGPCGVISRAACEAVGSCLTFGTAGEASAPGQMEAGALRQVLLSIHGAMGGEG
ncbi:MAG: type I 3-dehydroquinate dehydratase [Clostridia bacterium]|nr:type I 3-dehydroquinate dehydratase [Clostridia bacterium]